MADKELGKETKLVEYICTTNLQQESTMVEWVIQNFDLFVSLKNIHLDSSSFWTRKKNSLCFLPGGQEGDWKLRLSDNGSADVLGLYCFYRDHNNVSVRFKAGIIDADGNETHTVIVEGRMNFYFMGVDKFVKKSEIGGNLLKDKNLTIRCEITVTYLNRGTTEHIKFPESSQSEDRRLSSDMSALLNDKLFWDVLLLCGDEKFQAHKSILSARSSVFRAMFQHGMKESKENIVNIEDLEANILSSMLSYMYTGHINILGVHMAIKLFKAADKYFMDELKIICEKFLKENISFVNVLDVAEIAVFHHLHQLQEACVNYICMHKKELVFSNNLQPQFFSKIPPCLFEGIMKKILEDSNIIASFPCDVKQ